MVDIEYLKNRGDVEPYCILIESDTCDISKRIKQEIDSGYFIMFNPKRQKYELHHLGQPDSTYCLTFPFDELDGRAIEYARKTSITRAKTLMAEMKAYNERLEIEQQKEAENEAGCKAKDIYKYAIRHGVDGHIPDDIYTTKWN